MGRHVEEEVFAQMRRTGEMLERYEAHKAKHPPKPRTAHPEDVRSASETMAKAIKRKVERGR